MKHSLKEISKLLLTYLTVHSLGFERPPCEVEQRQGSTAQRLVFLTCYLTTESQRSLVLSKLLFQQTRTKMKRGKAKEKSNVFQIFLNHSVIIPFFLSQNTQVRKGWFGGVRVRGTRPLQHKISSTRDWCHAMCVDLHRETIQTGAIWASFTHIHSYIIKGEIVLLREYVLLKVFHISLIKSDLQKLFP